ncbi:MAG: RidA family protein [Abditibacteriota bacterium]|nr:RidA family protein [Abditibacteriota bacterium]
MIKTSFTKKSHKSCGHSSQTVIDSVIYVGGTMGIDPVTQEPSGSLDGEIELVIANLTECLNHAFTSWSNVLRVNIFLTDLGDFDKVDAALARALGETRPVYTVAQVSGLLKGCHVCIDLTAAAF